MSRPDSHRDGGIEIFALEDGTNVFAPEVFPGLAPAEMAARLQPFGETVARTAFNAFLLRGDFGLALVDTGLGSLGGRAGGRMAGLLAGMGVAPDDIGTLVFTHLHGDHCGGAIDGAAAVFGKARAIMAEAERAHWAPTDSPGARTIAAYGPRLETVTGDVELLPGLRAWQLPGHTPGHMGLRVGARTVIVGDIFHNEFLQLPDPSVSTRYDVLGPLAIETRRRALAEVCEQGLVMTGCHKLGPVKFARIRAEGQGYRLAAP